MKYQTTIKKSFTVEGVGLHEGNPVRITVKPAKGDKGIRFRRIDLEPIAVIEAKVDNVVETTLATVLGKDGATVSTVEHLLAALAGLGIDNATIDIDGPEVPIMDGSAMVFAREIAKVGIKKLRSPKLFIKIEKPLRVTDGEKFAILRPADQLSVSYTVDYDDHYPGEQHLPIEVTPDKFVSELCWARTFGFLNELEMLRAIGKAKGGSLDNAIVLDSGKVLNPEGLRREDELVCHKVLDAVGDIALAGHSILGHLVVHKGGHELHRQLVETLLAHPEAWVLTAHPEKVIHRRKEAARSVQVAHAAA